MRSAILATVLLLAANVSSADAPPQAPLKKSAVTRNLHFDWDDVKGASYYRLMYSVGSGAYRPAIDKVPAATSRATLSVPVHLASRPSLRYTVAACGTGGCAESNGISPHSKPLGDPALICGSGAAMVFATSTAQTESAQRYCMQRVSARYFAPRRFR
jgi:hypothetical protein